jgi:hypothetical protein
MSDQTPAKIRPHIQLAGDVLVPRREFAQELGITDKTAQRKDLPTTYIGNVAYVPREESRRIIAETVRRRNEPRVTRRRHDRRAGI